jgi:hypothetical protein
MRTSFHHQPEAQHPKSSAIHKLPADYPIFRGGPDISRLYRPIMSDANDPKRTLLIPKPLCSAYAELAILLFFSLCLPHSVRRKNIAKQRPTNHPRYRHPIRKLH